MTHDDTPVTTYHYPPRVAPQPVTLHGLDAVPLANASERTAPRRRTPHTPRTPRTPRTRRATS